MKVLKVLEKILLYLACTLCVASLTTSAILDESQGVSGMMTYLTSIIAYIGVGGVFTIVAALIIGTLLYFNGNVVVRKIAMGLVISSVILVFFTGLIIMGATAKTAATDTALSPVLSLVGGILYACSVLCGFIYYIVCLVKPVSEDQLDPVNDKKVILIMKWRKLMDEKIITEEEFMAKRNELLGIN